MSETNKKTKMSEPMKTLKEMKKKKSFMQKLVDARKEIESPKRSGNNAFKKYKYVTLQDLYDAVLPALLNEGLLLTNYKDYIDNKLVLKTVISDSESDESISTFGVLNENIGIQDHGSELTYHSRYNLGCLLSIRTDFDDDGEKIKDTKPSLAISLDQANEIKKLIANDMESWNLLAAEFGITKITELPFSKYKEVITSLKLMQVKKKKEVNEI